MSNFFLESVKEEPLTSLNDRNDLTRMAYQNNSSDTPLRNNSMTDRYEEDTFINHKESFENNNSRINTLNEEIRECKDKLRTLYEKEEEINSLKSDLAKLQKEVEEGNKARGENNFLRRENSRLKQELSDLTKQDNLSKEETIKIDVTKIKRILFTRLKDYHEKHIDDLIVQYDLNKKKEIDKSVMEKILLEAIHV
jgi:predicted RNase H-like nuclease (RuvC/YqgF family)|tara:strand:- start:1124 stop:1711 length:588 start_codon:yes stop_codon:yes gene_type:complete